MAINKRKVLDSARKFAQKGAKAKALKEYQLLLQADPRDAKLLLEVGDTYRRWGQNEDAIAQYAKVAQQYRQDGFDARAVAVYKQILNLDSKHYAAYVSLSELYQRMGLDAEAIGALQTAADGYHREGRKSDALELLRQMAALDPTNVTSRLKVAELLRQEKMLAEALSEYEAAARELENQQDRDQLVAVRERILELKPDHVGALAGMVRTLMAGGQPDRAEPFALRALQASPEPAQHDLLIELYAQMGNDAKLAESTRALAKLYRDRGDDDKARELMQRLPADEVGARSRLAVDVSEVDEPEIADDELLDDDPFITSSATKSEVALELGSDDLELEDEDEIQLELPPKPAARKPAPAPKSISLDGEGDPDQLLAEASVYLRYGKRAQAIQSLQSIIQQDPDHRAALEKLGEAYADDGQTSEAVAVWLRAAEVIRRVGDAKALSVLRDRIANLDPAAADGLTASASASRKPAAGPPESAVRAQAAPVEPEADTGAELELDFELAVEDEEPDESSAASAIDEVGAGATTSDGDSGFEIEIDAEGLSFGEQSGPEASGSSESGLSLSDDGSFEIELDPNEISADAEESEEGFSADGLGVDELDAESIESQVVETGDSASARRGTTTTTARIQEELEEAEFYIAQEMFDEAESILTRILELAPNHPSALLRMGEIQVSRGSKPETMPEPGDRKTRAGRRVAGTSEGDLGSTARFDDGIDLTPDEGLSIAVDESETESVEETSSPSISFEPEPGDGFEASDDPIGLDDDSGAVAVEATPATAPATRTLPPQPAAAAQAPAAPAASAIVLPRPSPPTRAAEAIVLPSPTPTAPREVAPQPLAAAAPDPIAEITASPRAAVTVPEIAAVTSPDAGDSFDLREALADVFSEPESSARAGGSGTGSTVEAGFESIFADFKKGVSAALGDGDYDTRFDLGIAYREMGLFEDAIGEFKRCLEAPRRRFDSLYLMGLCARDLHRYGDAVHHFEQALALPDLPEDRLAGVYFDLSLAQSLAGDRDRARASLRRVVELDPAFPNAAERLAELDRPGAPDGGAEQAPATGTGFESFDDLFADEASEEPAVESFESFDDVVSDTAGLEAETTARLPDDRSTTEPNPSDTPEKSGRRGGRKKISFV